MSKSNTKFNRHARGWLKGDRKDLWLDQACLLYAKLITGGNPYRRVDVNVLASTLGEEANVVQHGPFSRLRHRLLNAIVILSRRFDLELPPTDGLDWVKSIRSGQQSRRPRGLSPPSEDKIQQFYASYEWRKLRYSILLKYGRVCMVCSRKDVIIHVDHIKPLRKFWELRLNPKNLQVLCEECNHGKGNWDQTDWRPKEAILEQSKPVCEIVQLDPNCTQGMIFLRGATR